MPRKWFPLTHKGRIGDCAGMKQDRYTNIQLPLALNTEGVAPEWIMLLPVGEQVTGHDGRTFVVDRPQLIIDAFIAGGRPIAIDYEHASEIAAREGNPAPAAGWIEEMVIKDAAIFGRVAWTPKGGQMVRDREYRFISPALIHERQVPRVRAISSVGLVSQPNLALPALNNQTEEPVMDYSSVARALGLVDAASPEQCVAAIEKIKKDTETALNKAQAPDLDKFVPRADYDTQLEKATNAQKRIDEIEAATKESDIQAAVDQALKDGKIAPSTKDYHVATCRQEGGLDRFKEYVKTAPVIADVSNLDGQKADPDAVVSLNSEQKQAARLLGLSADEYLETLKREKEASE